MITPERLLIVLGVYALLFLSFRAFARAPGPDERATRWFLGLGWGLATFVLNWLLSLIGALSFLPWIANALHTFVWIGFCLSWLYLGVRFTRGFLLQSALFAGFSLIVKVAERLLLGTWEHDHFLGLFRGNAAYIVGWSLLDGLYPAISLLVLRAVAQRATKATFVVR